MKQSEMVKDFINHAINMLIMYQEHLHNSNAVEPDEDLPDEIEDGDEPCSGRPGKFLVVDPEQLVQIALRNGRLKDLVTVRCCGCRTPIYMPERLRIAAIADDIEHLFCLECGGND